MKATKRVEAIAANDSNFTLLTDFEKLLKLPVDHLHYYMDFLEGMMKNTAPTHQDFGNIVALAASLRDILSYLEQKKTDTSIKSLLAEVEKSIETEEPLHLLTFKDGARSLVRKGPLRVDKNSCFCFLMTDLLLVCTEHKKKKTVKHDYKLKYICKLAECELELIGKKKASRKTTSLKIDWNLRTNDGKKHNFHEKATDDYDSWYRCLFEIKNHSVAPKGIFGMPLASCLEVGTKVPPVVSQIISCLRAAETKPKGLFIAEGSPAKISSLQLIFDKGIVAHPEKSAPLDAACVLRNFLLNLPEPLFTFKQYNSLVNLMQHEKAKKKTISKLVRTLKSLPKPNLRLMKILLPFLHEVSSWPQQASHLELAYILAPCFVRPKIRLNIRSCYRTANVLRVVSFCIYHHEKILRQIGKKSASTKSHTLR
eukprot:TRINITY_DN6303_c0_g3_i1.p1 TRINITY_DN6303_c0_g3~~TRINITY_DN6303_c0_g3_i1.p1  ORF type:complete len:425 (+),score=53.64 TRINITY_DN6303_c0_g3_i1:308-1582(+)